MARRNIVIAVGACLFLGMMSVATTGCYSDESEPEEQSSALTSQDIKNGKFARGFSEAALINGKGYICSGSIIAPRVALTAGHCISGKSWTVIAPYARGQRARGVKAWTDYVDTGSFVNPNTNDVAVIVLDKPIRMKAYPKLAKEEVPIGTKAVNVGRIRDGRASSTSLFFGKPVALRPSVGFPFSYSSGQIIQAGDSGGPVYSGRGADRTIVAVNSGAGGGEQVLARVDLAFAKIQEIIAANGGGGAGGATAAQLMSVAAEDASDTDDVEGNLDLPPPPPDDN